MRNELEIIQTIERYLDGQMTETEKTAFQQELDRDPALQEELRHQRDIRAGLKRIQLKQQIRQTRTGHLRKQYLKWGIGGVLGALLIVYSIHSIRHASIVGEHTIDTTASNPNQYQVQTIKLDTVQPLPTLNEKGDSAWSEADRRLPAQVFQIDAGRDTVIETADGLVVSIPANAWVDQAGNAIKGFVQLTCKEALDAASIIRAGLSTRSGSQVLETGGMFLIDARAGGKTLQVSADHPLHVEVPAKEINADMQLYKGVRKKDGSIDWTDPQPLEHNLHPMDMYLLDFYPPGYIDSLKHWRLRFANRRYTDSLYFSMAQFFDKGLREEVGPAIQSAAKDSISVSTRDTSISPLVTRVPLDDGGHEYALVCGINPAKIKAIRTSAFQKTLVGTREFAERMPWIHLTQNPAILDLYISHLDWELWRIDSLVTTMHINGELHHIFEAFAKRRDGRVPKPSANLDKLREYYQRKTDEITQTISREQQAFWSRQWELDDLATEKKTQFTRDSLDNMSNHYQEELEHNLDIAYQQLGMTRRAKQVGVVPPPVYQATITSTGWCNIDRAVEYATSTRTTIDYTEPTTGRKAHIEYRKFQCGIQSAATFDRISVYLLPTELSSFIRVKDSSYIFKESLNMQLTYRLFCIGYKGQQAYVYNQDKTTPGDHGLLVLKAIDEKSLNRLFDGMGSGVQITSLKKDDEFFRFDISDRPRRQRNELLIELQLKVLHVIAPCYADLK